MIYSNLSKIRPKLRTSGQVTGNFGKAKVKAGSTLTEIGMTNAKTVKCATQDEYLVYGMGKAQVLIGLWMP